jgi:hypothetical protein
MLGVCPSRPQARQMVDPDQRRLAAVYTRKTEADDLRWVDGKDGAALGTHPDPGVCTETRGMHHQNQSTNLGSAVQEAIYQSVLMALDTFLKHAVFTFSAETPTIHVPRLWGCQQPYGTGWQVGSLPLLQPVG